MRPVEREEDRAPSPLGIDDAMKNEALQRELNPSQRARPDKACDVPTGERPASARQGHEHFTIERWDERSVGAAEVHEGAQTR
jgi:hypothetical protein